MKRIFRIAFLISMLLGLAACSRTEPTAGPAESETKTGKWPPLPTSGFVANRRATQDDLNKGDAAFLTSDGTPMTTIEIPQYAYLQQGGKRIQGIVIQAERTKDGKELIGMKSLAGSHLVGMLWEYKLLGKTPPE